MDGDEEQRSGGVMLADEVTADEAIGDTASPEAPDDAPAGEVDEAVEADVQPSDDAAARDEVAPPEPDAAPDDAEPQGSAEAAPAVEPASKPRRRSPFRRGAAVAAPALVVALAVSAFATSGSASGDVDQRFVDATRSQGLVVNGGEQQTLLVSAARKICDRRESHETAAQRRATALSIEELGSVERTFGDDARSFTALALETYCPN